MRSGGPRGASSASQRNRDSIQQSGSYELNAHYPVPLDIDHSLMEIGYSYPRGWNFLCSVFSRLPST